MKKRFFFIILLHCSPMLYTKGKPELTEKQLQLLQKADTQNTPKKGKKTEKEILAAQTKGVVAEIAGTKKSAQAVQSTQEQNKQLSALFDTFNIKSTGDSSYAPDAPQKTTAQSPKSNQFRKTN